MNNSDIKNVFYSFITALNMKDFDKFSQIFDNDVLYLDCQNIESKGLDKLTKSFETYFDKYCSEYVVEVLQYNDNGYSRVVGWGDYAFIAGMAGGTMTFKVGEKFIWFPICFKACFNNNKISQLCVIGDRIICPEALK